jgi:hypothetical protein
MFRLTLVRWEPWFFLAVETWFCSAAEGSLRHSLLYTSLGILGMYAVCSTWLLSSLVGVITETAQLARRSCQAAKYRQCSTRIHELKRPSLHYEIVRLPFIAELPAPAIPPCAPAVPNALDRLLDPAAPASICIVRKWFSIFSYLYHLMEIPAVLLCDDGMLGRGQAKGYA